MLARQVSRVWLWWCRAWVAASGLTNAYSRAAPILLVAGQIPRAAIGKNLGAVHEIADQPSAVRSVTKWQRQASRPREVPDAVFEAFRQMRTGRPRHRPISPAAHICRRGSGALRRGGGTRQARRGDEYSRRYLQWRQGDHSGRPSPVVRLLFQPSRGETGDEPALRRDAVRRRGDRDRRAFFAGQSRGRSGHAREHQHRRQ